MITLSSTAVLGRAVERSREVLLTAYVLRRGPLLDALEHAAAAGAHVTVRLAGASEGATDHGFAAMNAATAAALRCAGADARLVADPNAPMHMKVAVCDGVSYLDDCNWTGGPGETVLRDDAAADASAVEDAALGRPGQASSGLCTTKSCALKLETATLERAASGDVVEVESESFGAGSGVYGALQALAQRGVRCRLIVARRDLTPQNRAAVARLESSGVEVRGMAGSEKMAIVGSTAWVGSANATTPYYDGNQTEWALQTSSPQIVHTLQQRFGANWSRATPIRPKRA